MAENSEGLPSEARWFPWLSMRILVVMPHFKRDNRSSASDSVSIVESTDIIKFPALLRNLNLLTLLQ